LLQATARVVADTTWKRRPVAAAVKPCWLLLGWREGGRAAYTVQRLWVTDAFSPVLSAWYGQAPKLYTGGGLMSHLAPIHNIGEKPGVS